MKFRLAILALLFIAPVCRADSITDIASELRADVPIPFRYGVATDLATNILDAQASSTYASPLSLELSVDAVIRAIGVDNTPYVGWASQDPITWLQSTIAIDPGATIGITPSALYFGSYDVIATPEPEVWILLSVALVLAGFAAWRWLPRRKPSPSPPPAIMTDFGPTTEWARLQASHNMKLDAALRKRVEDHLCEQMGKAEGLAEARRRYPECYQED